MLMVKRVQCEIEEQIRIFGFLLALISLNEKAMRGWSRV